MTEIFDSQLKVTYWVPENKLQKTDPCLETILLKLLKALEKLENWACFTVRNNITYKGKGIRLALSPLLAILNVRR